MFFIESIENKHKDIKPFWIHFKDQNGKLVYADKEEKKPFRIKFAGIEEDVFQDEFYHLMKELYRMTGKTKETTKKQEKEKTDRERDSEERKLIKEITAKKAKAIAEVSIDCEGFVLADGSEIEFSKSAVFAFLEKYPFMMDQFEEEVKQKKNILEA